MTVRSLIGALTLVLAGHTMAADAVDPPLTLPLVTPAAKAEAASETLPQRPLWELGIGVAGLRLPDYRGSDESGAYLLPLPFLVYRGTFLKADRNGARALLVDAQQVKVDVSVAASTPSRSRDNAARAGMPNLPGTFEIGPNVNITLFGSDEHKLKLDLRLPLRAAVTLQRSPKGVGATFSPNLNLDIAGVAGGWNVGTLIAAQFADRQYHAFVYGVDSVYATPQRAAYSARGGYAGWNAVLATSRRFSNTWVGAFVRYDNLRGAVFEDSPLVRRSSGVTLGFGVSWIFATSSETVPSQD